MWNKVFSIIGCLLYLISCNDFRLLTFIDGLTELTIKAKEKMRCVWKKGRIGRDFSFLILYRNIMTTSTKYKKSV